MSGLLSKKELFLFDLDGVFYKGKESRVKIGGTRTIDAIRKKRRKLFILTNNSTDTAATVHSRLREFDIPVRREEVLTTTLLTAEHLWEKHGAVTYYLVGERGLDEEMKRRGHRRVWGEDADFVVVGLDRKVTYSKMDHAARLARKGAGIVATHDSRLYMYRNGPAMATGPLVRAIEYGAGKKATVIGKPSPLMFEIALRRAGSTRARAVMVGDQVDTDIAGAAAAGVDAILVTSGVDSKAPGFRLLATLGNVDEIASML